MHELSLMDNVLQMAAEHARAQEATAIHKITMRIGDMSGVSIDALTFAFDVLARDTMAAGAELLIEPVKARCRCKACAAEFTPDSPITTCPGCGAPGATLIEGREIELTSMEVS
ncbi:MAG: hydrogenase maturation nickel metallochaperone HypA [Chthonomonadales bacterium]|nr:hydrogenase maturation nickel metallochaperone HypA [Chthonomonadales bacterium]